MGRKRHSSDAIVNEQKRADVDRGKGRAAAGEREDLGPGGRGGTPMVLGLDIDGTITRHPGFFAALSQAFRAAGHRVVIITFREDRESTQKDLAEWGIVFDELVTSSVSEHLEHGVNAWKGVVCQKRGVQVLIDDDADVLKELRVPTLGLLVVPD